MISKTKIFSFTLVAASMLSIDTCHALQKLLPPPPGEANQTQTPQGDSAESAAFMALQKRIKSNQDRIDYLYRTLPIGFPKKRQEYKAEIERLTTENESLKSKVFDQAKAAFQATAQPSIGVSRIIKDRLVRAVAPRTAKDTFDPALALELISLLKEKFPNNRSLLENEFKAHYALERFEESQRALEELDAVIERDLSGHKQQLAATIEKYQQELMIRRQEASNNDLPQVRLETTEGDIVLELYENHAPNTVANFIHLVRDQKFYDGKLFHLVRPGEYCQSGSPNGDGIGGVDYYIPCECYEENIRSHFRGTISMLATSKDKGSSQFLITQQPNPHTFDGKYTAFGRVIQGMDVVMKLKNIDLSGRTSSTKNVSRIIKAEVIRARSHAYMPEKIAKVSASNFPSEAANMNMNKGQLLPPAEEGLDAPGAFDTLLGDDKNKN